MTKYILMLSLITPSMTLARGLADSYDVDNVRVDKSGLGFVTFKSDLVANKEELPDCGKGYPRSLAFDTNTEGGKAILSMALSAKMSGSSLYAVGTNECSGYQVIENMSYGFLE
ncbi:MAG: hypothetical protein MK185_12735 [Saccharospirillaceae bacterium]|nr:hypothetical protein [Saccharospirillaceae bacterium]